MTGPTRYEILLADWDSIRAEVDERTMRQCRIASDITYGNAADGLPFEDPHSHALAEMLGEISLAYMARGEPALSSIVVYVSGPYKGTPGPGFYKMMVKAGRLRANATEIEKMRLWETERQACFDRWGPRRYGRRAS